jgi:hypothetical protein
MRRRLAVLVGLLASALALGGCVSIQGISSEQQDVVGKLRVTVTVCASGADDGDAPENSDDHPGCFDTGNSQQPAPGGSDGDPAPNQLLVALRIPDGTEVPATVSGTPAPLPPATGPITLRRSASYEAELQALVPAPAGSSWAGYISDPYGFDDGADETPAQSVPLAFDLGLPRPADGAPYVGSLPVRPVVGARAVDEDLPADRPVDCGADPFAPSPPFSFTPLVVPETICIDSPTPAVATGPGIPFPTRDFGIVAGNATASPGQTVALPFGVRGAGVLPAGLVASLTATTGLPGASAAPSVPSAALSNGSDARVTVPVAIPAGAAAGTYEVALIGRLENGQERRGVAQLTVRARPEPPNVAPKVSGLRVKPKAFKPATRRKPKRGADVSYTLSEAASVRVVVERCSKYAKPKGQRRAKGKRSAEAAARKKRKVVARGRCLGFKAMNGAQTKAGKAGANGFRFNGKVGRKALKPGAYRLALTPTDAAGARGDVARAGFVIKR